MIDLPKRPQKRAEKRLWGVKFVVAALAPILNSDDPDVSFAYVFSGSQGSEDVARKTLQRAAAKVSFGPIPNVKFPDCTRKWADSLSGFRRAVVYVDNVNDDGNVTHGTCNLGRGRFVRFYEDSIIARYEDGEIVAEADLRLPANLKSWFNKKARDAKLAKKLYRRIDEIGAGRVEDE